MANDSESLSNKLRAFQEWKQQPPLAEWNRNGWGKLIFVSQEMEPGITREGQYKVSWW